MTIGVAACFSLLMLQLSGLHVHADEHGYVGGPETSYSHTHAHDHHGRGHHDDAAQGDGASPAPDHDYDDAQDVSLLELLLSMVKPTLAIPAFIFLFTILPRVRILVGTDFTYPILSGRHTRWRPPLRAPPAVKSI